ncbi:hypothetical protein GOD94_27650 [Sinorhizobium medicae]|nr:hypothetical protein [Sinorhizobium medicae]MDX0876609.1 hypothetical protein [Sinorhizobium medicae]
MDSNPRQPHSEATDELSFAGRTAGAVFDPDAGWAPFPVDTTLEYERFVSDYAVNHEPIQVSFRKLVHWIKGERAAHYIHPYPAKLLAHIAHFFLAARKHVPKDAVVLDPFSGSGTVPLETILAGYTSYWSDVNPLARAITKVKTTPIDLLASDDVLLRVRERYANVADSVPPEVVNINLWYSEPTIGCLARLRDAIAAEPAGDMTDLLWVTFSAVARSCSKADPRFSVPVRRKEGIVARGRVVEDEPDVWAVFEQTFRSNVSRMSQLSPVLLCGPTKCVGTDARALRNPCDPEAALPPRCVDLVITSPPYAGAQKYIRSSSLSIGWLGMASVQQMKSLDAKSIGREHFSKQAASQLIETGIPPADDFIRRIASRNPVRAAIVSNYLLEMNDVFAELGRVLRPNGRIVMVVGNNTICGESFETSTYMKLLAARAGFDVVFELVDTIKGRGLMTARNKTSGLITRELVLVFERRQNEPAR